MALDAVRTPARLVSGWSAILLGASIPVSTALDNILIMVILVAWALSGNMRDTLRWASITKVPVISALLFALLTIGAAYGDASGREALSCLTKYADLLLIPVFLALFRAQDTRAKALYALACSLAGILVLSYLIRFGLLPQIPFITGTAASPTVFKLKLTHNLFIAFGAFLFIWLGRSSSHHGLRIMWYVLALCAAANVLWMVQGATGYLVLGALALLLGWQYVGWRGAAVALVALVVVVAAGVSVPGPFQDRVTTIKHELQEWPTRQGATTSTGLRLEFYENSLAIIAQHPLFGVGTGGFPAAYAKQVAGTRKAETRNPHNEFLHLAVQVGVLGGLLLVVLLAMQWRVAAFLPSPMDRGLARGLVITMAVGCLLNSFLLDHAEGLFYAWLTGLLLGGVHSKTTATSPQTA